MGNGTLGANLVPINKVTKSEELQIIFLNKQNGKPCIILIILLLLLCTEMHCIDMHCTK